MSEWMTRKEAAERMKVHPRTVDRLIKDGRLVAIRLTPKIVRVSTYSIDRLEQVCESH